MWTVGSTIEYTGDVEGTAFRDHGRILDLEPGGTTEVTLEQDNNETDDDARNVERYWHQVLDGLKKVVERDE